VNRNLFFQRVLIFISFLSLLIIIFIYTSLITKSFYENDKATIALKRVEMIIKNLLKKELLKPRVRFSSFFINGNSSLLQTREDYQKAYNAFDRDEKLFFKNLTGNIYLIDLNLRNKNNLPVFFDNYSQYEFYPLGYIKANNQEDLIVNFKNTFLKRENIEGRENPPENSEKLLNYIYVDLFPDKKIIILLSVPFDPDPLYPNNSRQAIIICLQKKAEGKTFSSYIEKVNLNNEQ
jgi:hypothetical protein